MAEFLDFPYGDSHPNVDAHRWLDQRLCEFLPTLRGDAVLPEINSLLTSINSLTSSFQIAVLKASIERLPWDREQFMMSYREQSQPHSGGGLMSWTEPSRLLYQRGTVLYELVCRLYQRKLPYSELDICEILELSRHHCGHGGDVTPPFDILLAHARKHGISAELLGAARSFLAGLKRVKSSKAWHLKRKGAMLLLLDPGRPDGTGASACWSDHFRRGLLALPPYELRRWQDLVLTMSVNDLKQMPKVWRHTAQKFVAELAAEHVVSRLTEWWPDASQRNYWPIQTGGSHLLKHFVWLLETLPEAHPAKPACDELVQRLVLLNWKPPEQAVKFRVAAALYLAARPPTVAWKPLQSLAAKEHREGHIQRIVHDFSKRHGLSHP